MAVSSRAEELARKRSWIERVYAASVDNAREAARGASDSIRSLPSFFVIGPPRTGTTWLYEVLRNRALLPGPTKETRFFDTHFNRGMEWNRAHFPSSIKDRR